MLSADGYNGQVAADDDWVSITRKGFIAKAGHGFTGDKRIPLRSIVGVRWKNVGITTGYLRFVVAGFIEPRGAFSPSTDENTVTFKRRQQPEFEAIRDFVEAAIAGRPA